MSALSARASAYRIVAGILAFVLAVPGAILYLASYFWGAWLLAAAAAAYLAGRALELGRPAFFSLVRGVLRRSAMPAIGIVAALLLGAAIMLATGYNPLSSYEALFYGGLVRGWSVSVLNATPLLFTGLAVAFAFQGGLFNIGAQGQYFIGVMAATWIGLTLKLPGIVEIPLIFVAAAIIGAATNAIPAVLKVKTGAHEVVTTMMFAYAISTLSPVFIRAFGGDPSHSMHPYATDALPDTAWLPTFKSFLPAANYRLHIGIVLAIACAFLVRFILRSTSLGFKIRAVGYNPLAAKTQGISISWITAASLLISGALAAAAGATQVLGLDHRMFQDLGAGYGWNGISIALLARNNPVAIIFTSLLWGLLDSGGRYMAMTTRTPNSIIEIVKSIILFLLLAEVLYQRLGSSIGAAYSRLRRGRGARPGVGKESGS